jgi:3-deoxy-7-phosphoheptulonate synthase
MEHKTKTVKVGASVVGGGVFSVWAGPCAVESSEQFQTIAREVKRLGGVGLRGGVFKLRTDPEAFQDLGREAYDLHDMVDAFQVGSRNMHNYSLLKELGQLKKPVLLKCGLSALFKEWMLAAQYLIKGGNENVILCERGIRTFETATRNTFDINAIALAKQETHFPVLADPSHGTGMASLVPAVSLAAAAAGADGLLLEVHPHPEAALSDGYQSLNFSQFEKLMIQLPKVLHAFERKMAVL